MFIKICRLKRVVYCLLLLATSIALLYHSTAFWRIFYPIYHKDIIISYAKEYDVDPYLVTAVIRAESKFDPEAESTAGARGLMQIMPETGEWVAEKLALEDFDREQLFQPEVNICIGTWYLSDLRDEFADIVLVLAAYNGGRGNVKQWLEMKKDRDGTLSIDELPFLETRHYVKKVLHNYRRYREIYQ